MATVLYDVGISIKSKEDYDRLMLNHSKSDPYGLRGTLDFKGLFQGYPPGYPCLVQYIVKNPFDIMLEQQLKEIVNDGFHIHIQKDEDEVA